MAKLSKGKLAYLRSLYPDVDIVNLGIIQPMAKKGHYEGRRKIDTFDLGVDMPLISDKSDVINFGHRCCLPAISIEGNSFSIGYEDATSEHRNGIPVRRNGKVIGYVKTDGSKHQVYLNEGESLDLSQMKGNFSLDQVSIVGKSIESTILESIVTDIQGAAGTVSKSE